MTDSDWIAYDRAHIWHPYSTVISPPPVFAVASANGVRIKLSDGRELIDGMASWWSVIHGYNHPELNRALTSQLQSMAHVMFGGLTHRPAVDLAQRLIDITPEKLDYVFFSDSGSVSVEVALKMALQYWAAKEQPGKNRFMTVRGGYHGDTFGAMAVCDPVTGMHRLFQNLLPEHIFAPKPACRFDAQWDPGSLDDVKSMLERESPTIAAFIIEPIVQGAGGMWFYHPQYLRELAALCREHDVLLICDEIATGFARTGELFACEHAGVAPDILCLGKGLTGGYMSLAATLAAAEVANTISAGEPGVFMHGPTFMANPLACSVALASIDLLLAGDWRSRVAHISRDLQQGLGRCRELPQVTDVRVLGAIGVVELAHEVDMHQLPHAFVERGVWVRPFGKLVYVMPPYVIDQTDTKILTDAIYDVLAHHDNGSGARS